MQAEIEISASEADNHRPGERVSALISVILCTHNRCESLARTLDSLKQMCVPADLTWELLVIDNNSSDRTPEIVKSFTSPRTTLPLKYIFEPAPGLSRARNRGIQESQGAIIAFIDDDVEVAREWLREVRNAFQQYDPLCVGGRVLLPENSPRPPWWDKGLMDVSVGKFDRGTSVIVYQESDKELIGIGANIMFKRIVFEKYGLFRTDMGKEPGQLNTGEELEMMQRLRKQKELIIYYPNVLLYHCPSAERFSKRYLRQQAYSLGWWQFLMELDGPQPRILGIPRWRYRSALMNLWRMVLLGLRGRHTDSFLKQLMLVVFWGHLKHRLAWQWEGRKRSKHVVTNSKTEDATYVTYDIAEQQVQNTPQDGARL